LGEPQPLRRVGFDPDVVVDRAPQLLATPQVSFGGLDGDVSQQESDPVELSAGQWQSRAQVRLRSCGASLSMPALAAADLTSSHMTFGVLLDGVRTR
jgi:hypothetical protein